MLIPTFLSFFLHPKLTEVIRAVEEAYMDTRRKATEEYAEKAAKDRD